MFLFACSGMHKLSFFPMLIIRVPPNSTSFDALMKIFETIEHAQIEFFILIIRVPHIRLIDVWIRAI